LIAALQTGVHQGRQFSLKTSYKANLFTGALIVETCFLFMTDLDTKRWQFQVLPDRLQGFRPLSLIAALQTGCIRVGSSN
jgi:hypothetical protein